MTELTFLGTGNFLAPPGRYWNSFVLDGSVLVEPSPTEGMAPPAGCSNSAGAPGASASSGVISAGRTS